MQGENTERAARFKVSGLHSDHGWPTLQSYNTHRKGMGVLLRKGCRGCGYLWWSPKILQSCFSPRWGLAPKVWLRNWGFNLLIPPHESLPCLPRSAVLPAPFNAVPLPCSFHTPAFFPFPLSTELAVSEAAFLPATLSGSTEARTRHIPNLGSLFLVFLMSL